MNSRLRRYVPGFTGSTGHSAILLEHEGLLGADSWGHERGPDLDAISYDDETTDIDDPESPETVRIGIAILAWFPTSREVSSKVLDRYLRSYSYMTPSESIAVPFHSRFWDTYGSLLEAPRRRQKIITLSKELCRNTTRSMPTPQSSKDFIDSFTGRLSRWDVLGCLFTVYGATALYAPEGEPLLRELIPEAMDRNKQNFGIQMLECADACLLLCDSLDVQSSNPLSLCLFSKTVCLQSVPGGDASSGLWKRLGSLAGAMTAAGLHKRAEHSSSLVYEQTRRHIFASTFNMSSALATFHGRPPPLGRHFVDVNLPFDVSDEDLLLDDLALIEQKTDANGWNRDGGIHNTTTIRASFISSLIRDEILELSLGPKLSPQVLKDRGSDILDRMASTLATFPKVLQKSLTKDNLTCVPVTDAMPMAYLQMEWMQHRFLLERLNYAGKDQQLQLDAARDMLNGCVVVWQVRERFPEYRDDVHWFLTSYGIPAASSLGVDLYQSAINPHLYPPSPHRSKVIQDLSVYVICLEWVTPNDGNFQLCQRIAKWLKRILDRVLSLPPITYNADSAPHAQFFGDASSTVNGGGYPQTSDMWSSGPNGMIDLNNVSVADVPAFGGPLEDWFSMDWMQAGDVGLETL
ncbi:MAG: hypothetical protein M1828_003318 [Chrysothrix sp. TS-e1954]|nr:MAG: hypothetical protein M1828_003318 [Chrysothrix sp. TS-e1954]